MMNEVEWIGIDPTMTKKKAIAYACKKLGLPFVDVEFKWLSSVTLARPIKCGDDDDIEIIGFKDWLREAYPLPVPGGKHYKTYTDFGYDVFLIHAYPDEWNATGMTWEQIVATEKEDYYWGCIEAILDVDIDDDSAIDNLEVSLVGNAIVVAATSIKELEDSEKQVGLLGVELWEEDNGSLCLFLSDDDLLPVLCRDGEFTLSHKEFSGWDSIG